jgi:hypothetical protein
VPEPSVLGGVKGADCLGGAAVVTGPSVVVTGSSTTGTGAGEDSAGGGRIGRTVGVREGVEGRSAAVGADSVSVTLAGVIGTSCRCSV